MDDEKHCPKGPGGNTTLVNNDEAEILERTTQGIPMRAEGAQEGEFH
ncbi:hypothetical protein [Streptomyces tsukubensis]